MTSGAMRGGGVGWMVAAVVLLAGWPPPAAAQTDQRSRVFEAPMERVWVVARSTLKGLGWGLITIAGTDITPMAQQAAYDQQRANSAAAASA